MIIHPVLLELSRRAFLQVSEDGFSGSLVWEENRHHDSHRIQLRGTPNNLSMDLIYIVDLRYAVSKNSRAQLYVKALQKIMGQDEFEFYLKSLRCIEGKTHYSAECFAEFSSMDQIIEFLYTEMSKCNMFFDQVAAVARVCCRLGDAQGTDRYRKLLPTRLAEFTLHGMEAKGVLFN